MCVREAHLVVAVTSGTPDAAWLRQVSALQGCELLVLGPGVSAAVIAQLQPREVQVVGEDPRRRLALDATARRLAGRSLGSCCRAGEHGRWLIWV